MACIIEFDDGLRFDFVKNQFKQKIWIEALLKFSQININHLADILNLTVKDLMKIYRGEEYFSKEQAEDLGKLFLVMFSD